MRLLKRNLFVGTTLVGRYAKCGLLAEAREVFDNLPDRDVVSWNALITGYAEHGYGKEALKCLQQMQLESVSPDAITFVCSLKACGSIGATEKGQELHAEVARKGLLEREIFVGNALVDMYGKCGLPTRAQEVFDKLPVRDIVSWNALIAGYVKHGFLAKAQEVFDKLLVRNVVSWNVLITGYAEHGHGEEAVKCFEQMQLEGVSPNRVTFVCSLKACGIIGATDKGREIHAEIARKGLLERDLVVGSTLVDMYAKCGSLAEAQEVFDKLLVRNVVSWTALIAGYAEHGCGEEALKCFGQMEPEGVSPNAVTFICSLKACGSIGVTDKGREIHAEIAKKGLLERDLVVGNALVDMYAKCGSLVEAQELFDKLQFQNVVSWNALISGYAKHGFLAKAQEMFDKLLVKDVVSWNALIAGYAEHGHGEKALNCFDQMQLEGVCPDAVTLICSLKACCSIGPTDKGRAIHSEIARKGLLERDLFVGNTLVDMYAKCGSLAKAQEVFDKLSARDVVSWNALIAGYAEHGHSEKALKCFEQMQLHGVSPDAVTFMCSLKACGSTGITDKGREIHAEIVRKGLLEKEHAVGNTLVDMYAKCGSLTKAQETFDKLPVRDVVSWNALIAGYAEHGHGEEALTCFEQMQLEGVSPNVVTLSCSLKACGRIGVRDKGQEIHAEIVRKGLLERDIVVGNTLVDMYAKCGSLAKAEEVLDKLCVRDVISWNAIIAGYAQLGESENVFHSFDRMIGEGIKPNLVTFVSVLKACCHTCLFDKGWTYFHAMSKDYGIVPTFKHHTCMVDLLGCAGQLDKAVAMINKMTRHTNLVVWHSVLGACRKWGNVELGRHAFEHAVQLDEKDAAAYVFMSYIYAGADMQEEANKMKN